MSVHPHPFTMTMIAEQRHAEFRAEAHRAHLRELASREAARPGGWTGHPAPRWLALILALLHAAAQRG